ncbi:MAG: 23S rRNA (pseudouridine(1915)-N(3))-methyltransferase RlmH, partial [Flavobacteriaceae bacterium]|nr:23S rRNA (pseudouridine(1915)-N(3))-methyltransferase RlmH [Flavobacteriaceae bacterium]
MKIKCIVIGKTKNQEIINMIKSYTSKIEHYINFE